MSDDKEILVDDREKNESTENQDQDCLLYTSDGIHHICHYVKVYGYVILDIQVQILVQHTDGTCGAAKKITLRSLPVFTVGIIQIRITVNRQQLYEHCTLWCGLP